MVKVSTGESGRRLRAAFKKAKEEGSDLTVPLKLIAIQWMKSNVAIFTLKGPGKYQDYGRGRKRPTPYEKFKIRKLGSQYPMMKLTGLLESSLTEPGHPNSVGEIINRNSLFVGTTVPYAAVHQNGQGVPTRPVVLFGNEQVAPPGLDVRLEQWRKMILNWVAGKLPKEV